MSESPEKCIFCTQPAMPNPYASGWKSRVCAAHRSIPCPLCGRYAWWVDGKAKHYACSNFDCDWVGYEIPPKSSKQFQLN